MIGFHQSCWAGLQTYLSTRAATACCSGVKVGATAGAAVAVAVPPPSAAAGVVTGADAGAVADAAVLAHALIIASPISLSAADASAVEASKSLCEGASLESSECVGPERPFLLASP